MKKVVLSVLFLAHFAFSYGSPELRSAAEKELELFERILATEYGAKLPPIDSASTWEKLSLLDSSYDAKAFSHSGDVMMKDRQKLIHGFGTTALISFVPSLNHPYTGLFSAGAPYGMLRVSLARPPTYGTAPDLLPGMALKFFIDKKPSLNIMAMPSLDAQSETNIFAHSYTTDVKEPTWSVGGWLLQRQFAGALYYVGQSGGNPRSFSLQHLASQTSMGEPVVSPVEPYAIVFVPSKALHDLCDVREELDFRKQLEGKGHGMTLFEVFAKGSPEGKLVAVGTIEARSNFIASAFGDTGLFFKHPPVHIQESLDEL